jgi:hypothetical protein
MKVLSSPSSHSPSSRQPPVLAATHHNEVVDRPNHLNRSAQPNDDRVIRGGQIIGTDPDPNVRSEIMREYKQGW